MRLAKFNPNHDKRGRFARRPESAVAADEPSGQKAYQPTGESLGDVLLNAFHVFGRNNAEIDLGV